MAKTSLSVVIPAYNEEGNVDALYKRLKSVLEKLKADYEVIFVDDGSTDATFSKIKKLHEADRKVKGIQFQKNFGKSAAYMAGFKAAVNPIIVTMDADLQDDPDELPRLLEALNNIDLVVGWKYPRRGSLPRSVASKAFNTLNQFFFGLKIHDSDSGYRAMKAVVVKELNLYGDLYRYIPAMVHRRGYRVGEVKVKHHKRMSGKTKYSSKRLLTGMLDLLTVKFLSDFNQRPLHLFGAAGVAALFLGFMAEVYVLYYKIIVGELFAKHMPMLIFGVLLIMVGVQLLGIGLIGELVTASNKEVERYKIREFLK